MIQTLYQQLHRQKIHFRAGGKGLPIVLFHASPSSSKMFVPLVQALSPHFLVIAPDTPGYGLSQPLQLAFDSITEYVHFFHQFLHEELGLRKFAIYGTATGAQIGIRYGLEFPEQVSHLFLDNTAHFTEVQRNHILENYFPNLTPKLDGSHLKVVWKIVSQMFGYFPWYATDEAHRLHYPPMPAAVLNQFVKDFLQAGANYATAYRAAFRHEKAEFVQALRVPTTLFNWVGSIIRPYTEQLLTHDLPSNVTVLETPADKLERQKTMLQSIRGSYVSGNEVFLEEVVARVVIGGKKENLLAVHNIDLPKVEPDLEGNYLKEAWQMILAQKATLEAAEVQSILNEWLQNKNSE